MNIATRFGKEDVLAFVFCQFGAVADWASTTVLLDGSQFTEGNPGAAFVIGHLGLVGFLLFKLAYPPVMSLAGSALIGRMTTRWPLWTRPLPYLVVAGVCQLAAACSNLALLM